MAFHFDLAITSRSATTTTAAPWSPLPRLKPRTPDGTSARPITPLARLRHEPGFRSMCQPET